MKLSTEGFQRYLTPEGRQAFVWAVYNLPAAGGELASKATQGSLDTGKWVPTLRTCFAHADPIENEARKKKGIRPL